jgi:hypothetical protein
LAPPPIFSFLTPIDWHRFAWPDDSLGEIHGPDQDDPLTVVHRFPSTHDVQRTFEGPGKNLANYCDYEIAEGMDVSGAELG